MFKLPELERAQRARAISLLIARLFASAASTTLVPYLVLLLTSRFGLSALAAALLAALVFVGGRLFARPLGVLADRKPDAPLLPACLVAGGVAALLFLFDGTQSSIAAAATACIGLSLSSTAFMVLLRAHIARSFPAEALSSLASASSSMFNVGMFVGAAIGGYCLDRLGWVSLVAASATLHAAAALIVVAATADPNRTMTQAPGAKSALKKATQSQTGSLAGSALMSFVLASATLGYFTTTVSVSLVMYMQRAFGDGSLASWFYSAQSLALMFLLPGIGVAIGRFAPAVLYRMYFGGLGLLAVGYCLFALVPSAHPIPAIGVLALFFCASQCLAIPSADPLLTQLFGTGNSGRLFGTTTSAAAAGGMLACLVNGLALDRLPPEQLGWLWSVPGVLGCVVLAAAAVLGSRVLPRGLPNQAVPSTLAS